jgi:hypothetical protein
MNNTFYALTAPGAKVSYVPGMILCARVSYSR